MAEQTVPLGPDTPEQGEQNDTRSNPPCAFCFGRAFMVALAVAPARADNFPSRPLHLIMPYGRAASSILPDVWWRRSSATVWGRLSSPKTGLAPAASSASTTSPTPTPDGYNIVHDGSRDRHQSDAAKIRALRHLQRPGHAFDRQLVAGSFGRCAAAWHQNLRASLSLTAKPIRANSTTRSAGVGTTPHLAAAMWTLRTGIVRRTCPIRALGLLHRPDEQQGSDAVFQHRRRAAVYAKGSVIPLATTGAKRSPVYPDLPTVAEAGLPGYDVDLWLGLWGRAERRPTCWQSSTPGSTRRCKTPN